MRSRERSARRPRGRWAPLLIAALMACRLGTPVDGTESDALRSTDVEGPGPIRPGPRALALLDTLEAGPLRERLEACREGPFAATRFVIGHRGAPLHHPEHTRESYVAAARMGAGVLECDVTFTADRVLVCRHAQCDLATTTDILETPLAQRCREPFRPAVIDASTGQLVEPAGALCCTSDLRLDELRRLRGRHDRSDPSATSLETFLAPQRERGPDTLSLEGTLVTHDESIALFRRLGVAMTPELKATQIEPSGRRSPSRRELASALVDAYRRAGVPPEDVWLQSFELEDLSIWQEVAPAYAPRAIWLDGREPTDEAPPAAEFAALRARGIRRIGPPLSRLLRPGPNGSIAASEYARRARAAGLELVTWTLERSGTIRNGRAGGRDRDFYLSPILPLLRDEGDVYRILAALHREVGVRALFTDSPSAPTLYASCLGLD